MFDPRKLMPLSIEDWSAPIAVITEITEKTPIVMPIMVSPARSLLAPNDASAILEISLNNIDNLFTAEDAEQNHRITPSAKPKTRRRKPCFSSSALKLRFNSLHRHIS